MDNNLLNQLVDLARAFHRIGLQPVICGGLGVYLLFRERFVLPDRPPSLRATQDIDLMITRSQAEQPAKREAIAAAILRELEYIVCEDGRHFRFNKGSQQLDVLALPTHRRTTTGRVASSSAATAHQTWFREPAASSRPNSPHSITPAGVMSSAQPSSFLVNRCEKGRRDLTRPDGACCAGSRNRLRCRAKWGGKIGIDSDGGCG